MTIYAKKRRRKNGKKDEKMLICLMRKTQWVVAHKKRDICYVKGINKYVFFIKFHKISQETDKLDYSKKTSKERQT